jgi:energy-coupling factor transporter ATP-binding protein EcfA2
MLNGVMEHCGFRTSLKPVAYYDSEYHQQLLKELKAAIHGGGLVALTGIVGSGKTVLVSRLQQAYRLGEKPVTPAIVGKALAPDRHDRAPTLTRYGDNIPALAALLNIRQAEVRGFLHGPLPPGRTEELHQQLLAVSIPLGERLGVAEHVAAIGRDGQAAVG